MSGEVEKLEKKMCDCWETTCFRQFIATSLGLAVAAIAISVAIVLPVRQLNPGPALVPDGPGYNQTNPSDGWTFRFQPLCGSNNYSRIALAYLQVHDTALPHSCGFQ